MKLRSKVIFFITVSALGLNAPFSSSARAAGELQEAQSLYYSGQYFKAARYAFQVQDGPAEQKAMAQAWVALSLHRAGLSQAAAYFFIKTLLMDQRAATQKVLPISQELMVRVGVDLLRRYLVLKTSAEDYDAFGRAAFHYSLGKEMLLRGRYNDATKELSLISPSSPLYAFSLQLRATAYAILGQNAAAVRDFENCIERSEEYEGFRVGGSQASVIIDSQRRALQAHEAVDLRARCQAGIARTYYQADQFEKADREYDRIPKSSLVWTDILFEQGWNSFGKNEYNRTLGKLVSYKSPALEFVYNSEIDVLSAHTYLNLCLYNDANQVINQFNSKYVSLGEEIKAFVEGNASELPAFYRLGKDALRDSLYTKRGIHQVANRFVRSSYFENLVLSERAIQNERRAIDQFGRAQPGVNYDPQAGFPGFLNLVLNWRLKTVQSIGGAFVKNSLMDYHSALVSDFEKMAFLKLEMLGKAKETLIHGKPANADRNRGNIKPKRRDDQYLWTFNGEFWSDELGDYVFGLESECGKK